MSTNLRQLAERDLGQTLEGEFKVPVELIGPNGQIYNTSQTSLVCGAAGVVCGGVDIVAGVSAGSLGGQVLYDTVRVNPDTGEDMVVNNPIVTLRRSSLQKPFKNGEKWIIRIPLDINNFSALSDFAFTATRAHESGRSLGIVRIYPTRVLQS